jgi:hypothetical protein
MSSRWVILRFLQWCRQEMVLELIGDDGLSCLLGCFCCLFFEQWFSQNLKLNYCTMCKLDLLHGSTVKSQDLISLCSGSRVRLYAGCDLFRSTLRASSERRVSHLTFCSISNSIRTHFKPPFFDDLGHQLKLPGDYLTTDVLARQRFVGLGNISGASRCTHATKPKLMPPPERGGCVGVGKCLGAPSGSQVGLQQLKHPVAH